jgi:Ca2+/Na+ antiporter
MMSERLNLIGAVTALVIFISSIITFSSRMIFEIAPGHWVGTPLLLMVFPLAYLLIKAPGANRPFLYYVQAGLMLLFIILLFFVDFVFQYDFRQTQWMVISFVTLYFAAMGGMIGIASLAGRAWTISSVILFFIAAILAFVQRAVTGY